MTKFILMLIGVNIVLKKILKEVWLFSIAWAVLT